MVQEQEICSDDELQNNCVCNPVWHNNVMWVRVWELYPTSFPVVRPWIWQHIETMCRNSLKYVMACVWLVQCKTAELGMEATWVKIVFKCWCLQLVFLWVTNSPVYLRCALFWHIKRRRVVIPYLWFGTTYRCHSQGSRSARRMSVKKLHIFCHYFTSDTVRYFCSTEWFLGFLMYVIRNWMTAERQTNHTGKYIECPISLEP